MRQPWLVMTIGNRRKSMNFTALDYESTQKHTINIMSQVVAGRPDRSRTMKFTAHYYEDMQNPFVNIMRRGVTPRILHNFLGLGTLPLAPHAGEWGEWEEWEEWGE